MANGIYSGLSGAIANERRVDLISHNLANINTSGFQQFRMALEEVKGAAGSDQLSFAMPSPIKVDTTPGPISSTGNPLDIALTEGVHMAVIANGKEAFIRGGTLMVLPDGRLTTNEGLEVLGKEEPINLPQDARDVIIHADGTVEADGVEVDKLRMVEFERPEDLIAGAGNKMMDPGTAGRMQAVSQRPVIAGYIERSNLNAVRGITDLITAHRSYDATMKVLETFSHIEKRASKDIR